MLKGHSVQKVENVWNKRFYSEPHRKDKKDLGPQAWILVNPKWHVPTWTQLEIHESGHLANTRVRTAGRRLQPSPGSYNRFAILSDDSLTSGLVETRAMLRTHPKVLPGGQEGYHTRTRSRAPVGCYRRSETISTLMYATFQLSIIIKF